MHDTGHISATPDNDWCIAMSNDLAGLKQGLNGLGAWLEQHKIGMETENRARLVFEEIVTNVIRYGFEDNAAHIIHAAARVGGEDLTLSFRDDGRPFDPRTAGEPAPTYSLAQASIGGRGLMLVRAAASRIAYERTSEGRNHLTVTLPRQ
jgi:anti-sigma regulatory factor (Ser/Thr protein kinase)